MRRHIQTIVWSCVRTSRLLKKVGMPRVPHVSTSSAERKIINDPLRSSSSIDSEWVYQHSARGVMSSDDRVFINSNLQPQTVCWRWL